MGQEGKEPGKRPPLRSRLWAWTGFGDKTLWDWLQLLSSLAIPVVLAAAGLWFTAQQERQQQWIENERAASAQHIEEQRAQDAALQAYLDQMSTLLIDKNLRTTEDNAVVSTARARTLAVLPMLDGPRKYSILVFLLESQLISEESTIVWLAGADLSELEVQSRANLRWDLRRIFLHGADLSNADLHRAVLRESALTNTDLSGADLSGADLTGVELHDADLTGADLSGADLTGAELPGADLSGAKGVTKEVLEQQAKSLRGATMPDGTTLSER